MKTNLIKQMLVTEKSAIGQGSGKYTFLVNSSATKSEIKKAVKELYKVDVDSKSRLSASSRSAAATAASRL
jgi:ribosomal protein L23